MTQHDAAQAINTRTAWRPILKPVARLLIAAQLALVLQPLSVLAQEKGQAPVNPAGQAQLTRLAQWDQKIQQAKAQTAAAAKSPADQVSDKLSQAEELVAKLKRAGTPDKPAKHQQLKALLAEIRDGTAHVRSEFAATRAALVAKKLPAEILRRHDQAVAQFEQRAAQFNAIAAKANDDERLLALSDFYGQHPTKRKPLPLGKKLPWSTPEPNKRAPAETRTAWFQNLYGDQKVRLAQAGGSVGPLQFNIPPEPGQAPATTDLAETDEIVLTDGIRAKAAELGHNPVAIYNWVRNHIEWVPTNGAIQSAQDTLDKQRGNATDTASLLIALLRAANIPARYQWGTIDVDAAKAQNWVGGATKPEAVLQLLSQGGIAARGLAAGGRIATIRMEHVWVSAYVNWSPSRGSRNASAAQHVNPNGNLNAWVPLDASFKQYSYSPGMDLKTAVPLDAQALLDAARQGATVNEAEGWVQNLNQAAIQTQLQNYQTQLQNYINSTPTGANSTVGDVIGKKIIPQKQPNLLAGVTPNPIVVQTAQASAIPSNLQHKFTYSLYASQTDQAEGMALLTYTEKTSKLVGKRLTLTYVPASQADADVIASYLPQPHADGSPIQASELPTSLPGYLIKLKAQINLDGQVVAQASQALNMGTDLYSTGGFTQLYDTSQWDLTSEETNTVGNVTAIGVSAGGISPSQMSALKERLQATQIQLQQYASGNQMVSVLLGEHVVGDVVASAVWSWFQAEETLNRLSQDRGGTIEIPGLSYGLFHGIAQATESWGVIRSVGFPKVNYDIGHVRNLTWAKDNDPTRMIAYNQLRGHQMSGLEAARLDDLFDLNCNASQSPNAIPTWPSCSTAISAVRVIALAGAQGQKVYTIDRQAYVQNPEMILAKLSAHNQNVQQRVQNYLDAGYEIRIHQAPILVDGMSSTGFVALNPETGAGAYLIDGGSNGGLKIAKGILSGLGITLFFTGTAGVAPILLTIIAILTIFVAFYNLLIEAIALQDSSYTCGQLLADRYLEFFGPVTVVASLLGLFGGSRTVEALIIKMVGVMYGADLFKGIGNAKVCQ